MANVETVVMSVVFIVFVVAPLATAIVLVERWGHGFTQRQDYRFAATVLGIVFGFWVGLLAGFVISEVQDIGLVSLLLICVAAALLGGVAGRCGEEMIHERPVMKHRRVRL